MTQYTADDAEVVHGIRVWTGYSEPGTVDLNAHDSQSLPDCFVIHTDGGRRFVADGANTRVRHALTDMPPPDLGQCRWLMSCDQNAFRMQPHVLMSPVPVCSRCINTFDLP